MTNTIHCENCLDTMARMPDGYLDMTLCSPPYDDLRVYKGYSFDAVAVAESLFRVTKDGGVVVWVVSDRTKDGDESGTSFRHALTFKDVGFKLWDTMIWRKTNPIPTDPRIPRYQQAFEYMFVFSKGTPICNQIRVACSDAGRKYEDVPARRTNGAKSWERPYKPQSVQETKVKSNVWDIPCNNGFGDGLGIQHPAIFPYELAYDHISSWSNEGDLVYDCFMGSGTTAIAAVKLGRNYIGSEISDEYTDLARKRIEKETALPLLDATDATTQDSKAVSLFQL